MSTTTLDITGDLLDQRHLPLFKDILLAHGGLGYRHAESYQRVESLSEFQKLQIVPFVFSLLPKSAIQLGGAYSPVKPVIQEHLQSLGMVADDDLLGALKRIADQYAKTDKSRAPVSFQPRKMGMADLRMNRSLYKLIKSRQRGRCCICGAILGMEATESLDHVIPYRLLGDVTDGANWQILCEPCNRGKSDFISAFQSREAISWFYGRKTSTANELSEEGRYVTLRRFVRCSVSSCGHTSKTSRLHVRLRNVSGLALPIHMEVVCDQHLN